MVAGDGLSGNYRVRAIRPALHKVYKILPRCRDQMELRAHTLKLRYWPDKEVTDETGNVVDLNWSWIVALRGKNIGELRVEDRIGWLDNIRVIFFKGDAYLCEPLPMIWVLDVLVKKKDYFTSNELKVFDMRRLLVIERFYKNRNN